MTLEVRGGGSDQQQLVSPEFKFLRGIKLAGGRASAGPTAANFDHVLLVNPVGSGILITCTHIEWTNTADVQIGWHTSFAGSVNVPAAPQIRDSRFSDGTPASIVPVGEIHTLVQPTFLAPRLTVIISAFERSSDETIIIAPGHVIAATSTALNQAVGFAFTWEERPLILV